MTTQNDFTKLQNYEFRKSYGCRSVSGLVSSLQVPFDRDGKAAEKAKELGVTPQEIIAQWEAKGERTRRSGLELHEYIKSALSEKQAQDSFEALSSKSLSMVQFDLFWQKARAKFTPVWLETTISSAHYRAIGRIDALLYDKDQASFHIVDWKSGTFSSYGYRNLLKPFGGLRDSSIDLAGLQTAIYRLVIEKETGVSLGDSYVVYISDDSHNVHLLPDYRTLVEAWLLQREAARCHQ